eukprot:15457175-Alexandrium_andersonii.AAC.1
MRPWLWRGSRQLWPPTGARPRVRGWIAGLPGAPASKRRPGTWRGLSGAARVCRPSAGLGS